MYRGNRSLSKIWIEEEGGSRAGENESIVSAIDRGSGFLLSAFHQKMALWDAYQVLFFVSFKMNPRILSHRRPRQIHASSIPGTVSLVDRSPFTEGLRDDRNIIERQQRDAFRGILWGEGKKNAVKRPRLRRIHFNHLHLFPSPGDSPSGHRGEPSSLLLFLSFFHSPSLYLFLIFSSLLFSFLISQPPSSLSLSVRQ